MENLEYGWKKSIKAYHYFPIVSNCSLCIGSSYTKSELKKLEFFADFEITADMSICQQCRSLRKNEIKHEIIREKQSIQNYSTSQDYAVKQVVCSEQCCNVRGVALVSITKEEKEHYCLKHNLRVTETIRKEIEGAFVT